MKWEIEKKHPILSEGYRLWLTNNELILEDVTLDECLRMIRKIEKSKEIK